jgi:DME family drug/metabolite transporter
MMPIVYLASTIPIVSTSFLTNMSLSFPIGLEATLVLLGLGIIPTAFAHTLYFSSLSGLKSFETATLALLEPIGATLLGIVLFQEIPVASFLIGAVILLTGVTVVLRQ